MSLKIGFVNDSSFIYPCGFYKPPCKKPGPFVELAFFIVQHCILFAEDTSFSPSLEILPMEHYHNHGSKSIIGSLLRNETDISPAYMFLTEARNKILSSVFPVYPSKFIMVYKRVEASEPNLGLFTASQWHVWAFAVGVGMAGSIANLGKRTFCGRRWLFLQYLKRQNLILAFFFGVFLRYISTQLVFLFAEINVAEVPFTNTEEFLLKLETKDYRAVVFYQASLDEFINPLKYRGKSSFYNRLVAAHQNNPALFTPTIDDAMKLVLNSSEKLVLITSSLQSYYLRSTYCSFNIVTDSVLPTQWYTMYTRPGLILDLNSVAAHHLINMELNRLHLQYFPPKECSNVGWYTDHGTPGALSFFQLQSLFWMLGAAILLALLALIIENLKKKLQPFLVLFLMKLRSHV